MMARASRRVTCNNAAHAATGGRRAAIREGPSTIQAQEPGARTDALVNLRAAAAHFDPEKLFEGDDEGPEHSGNFESS